MNQFHYGGCASVQLRNESVPYGGCTHTVEKSKLGGGEGGKGGSFLFWTRLCTVKNVSKLHNCVTKKTLSRNVFLVESVSTCTT
jgi:hypothetical protein